MGPRMNLQKQSRQGGFSLIELMIGVALGLIVLAALTSFFVSSSASRHEIERTSRQIENGRFAIDALRNEIHLAGFYAELQQTGATWQMPDPCLKDAFGQMGLALGPPLNIPLPISGYAADAAMPGCLVNHVAGTDVLVIRRFNTEPTPVASAAANQFYFQSSRCATDSNLIPWTFANGGSATFNLHQVDCKGLTDLYRLRVEVFYIRDWSYVVGDKIPTLVKLDLDGSAINTLALVEGIKDMRLEYGIDTTLDGTPDEYRRCDTATPCTLLQWSNVTTVRVNLLSVNLEDTVGYTDTKVYDMGSGGPSAPRTVGPFAAPDNHTKKRVYTAVVSASNRTGPRE